jgi:hypothetical protein
MTLYGTSDVVELAPILDRDDQGRWTTTRRWRGLLEDLQTLADSLGGRTRISQEDAVWHLMELTVAGLLSGGSAPAPDTQIVTVYDLDYARGQRSHWLRADVQAELAKITDPAGRAQFRADVTAIAKGERVVLDITTGRATQRALVWADLITAALGFGIDTTLLTNLVSSLAAGDEEFVFEVPIVKVQRVAPPGSSIRAQFGGINRYLSTATLLNRYPDLPEIIAENISSQLSAGYWQIAAPRIKTQDATRVLIEELYEYADSYNTWSYGAPLTA